MQLNYIQSLTVILSLIKVIKYKFLFCCSKISPNPHSYSNRKRVIIVDYSHFIPPCIIIYNALPQRKNIRINYFSLLLLIINIIGLLRLQVLLIIIGNKRRRFH